jgi:hypothetical protein
MTDLARIFSSLDVACQKLATGLGGPAGASTAAEAARDMAALFGELTAYVRERYIPDEYVIDDDGPNAGVMRRATLADYAAPLYVIDDDGPNAGVMRRATLADYAAPLSDAARTTPVDQHGRPWTADHYRCPQLPCPGGEAL